MSSNPVSRDSYERTSVCVSIVSHGHGTMVTRLIAGLLRFHEVGQIVLTLNVPEHLALPEDLRIQVVENNAKKGFGANHNAAFQRCRCAFFCVVNPDIELSANPFPELLEALKLKGVVMAAPLVVSPAGLIEDSIRYFPRPLAIWSKFLFGSKGCYPTEMGQENFFPEWCAGMFMLFRSEGFAKLSGFDEAYFLYYEDVDICVRIWKRGMGLVACPKVSVVHDARRDSRRSLRHLRWHIASMLRFFAKHWLRLPKVPLHLGAE